MNLFGLPESHILQKSNVLGRWMGKVMHRDGCAQPCTMNHCRGGQAQRYLLVQDFILLFPCVESVRPSAAAL